MLAAANSNIIKFSEKHNIDDIKTHRYMFNYYNRLKGSEKDLYLSSNNIDLETIKTANKLYIKLNRLKKKKEKVEQELHNFTSVNNTSSPTSITTTFFSTNQSVPSDDRQSYLKDTSKTLFASDNTSTQTPIIRKKVRRQFILSKNILSSQQDKNYTFNESIFVCSECNNGDGDNQHFSTMNESSNNRNTNNEQNSILPIDGTYTAGNINSSNTPNNNDVEDEVSLYQDNTPKQSPNINYDIEGYFCHNCHRNNTLDYFFLYKVQLSSLNKKKKLRIIQIFFLYFINTSCIIQL